MSLVGWLVGHAGERLYRDWPRPMPQAFHSNHGSFLLSFRDMTTGRTTDGQMSAPTHIWLLRGAGNKVLEQV